MKFKRILSFLVISSILSSVSPCLAQESQITFNEEDRVLILAPHPDDESIATSGVIQQALKNRAKVKIVLFTNGDSNELSFIVYEKRLTVTKKEMLHMGRVRAKESICAMNYLGIKRDDIIFLGYPDLGTMEIFTKHWDIKRPYKSLATRVSEVSYPEAKSYGAAYTGQSVLKDLKDIIIDFKPTKIFVSHPADANRDHRALYLFLKVCLWDLEGKITMPQVFSYVIHVVSWPMPRGYHPKASLNPPNNLNKKDILWRSLDLSDEETKIKHDAISFYKSQIEYNPPYLFTFARKNELFDDLPPIKLAKESSGQGKPDDFYSKEFIEGLSYLRKDNNLFITLYLKRRIGKQFGLSFFLLGYNKVTDFSKMPKIHIAWDLFGFRVANKQKILLNNNVKLIREKNALILKIPLALLGEPDYILSCTTARDRNFPLEETVWRTLKLE